MYETSGFFSALLVATDLSKPTTSFSNPNQVFFQPKPHHKHHGIKLKNEHKQTYPLFEETYIANFYSGDSTDVVILTVTLTFTLYNKKYVDTSGQLWK